MRRDDQFVSMASELAVLATSGDLALAAERIVAVAMRNVDCDFGGLSVIRPGGGFDSVATTDPLVDQADALQYELSEGPCVAAAWTESTLLANDLAADSRWPTWGPKAAALGFSSLLAARLSNGPETIGALNLYSTRVRDFSGEEMAFADIFAGYAASTLMTAREIQHLRIGMDARTIVGQAQGILMERFDLDDSQAFAVLKRYSQNKNVKLRVVAEGVIERRQRGGSQLLED
jgi:GAF domain-containing protein